MRIKILEMMTDVVDLSSAASRVVDLARKKQGSYVCVSNVHMCMEVRNSTDYARVVNSSDLTIPDGRPISWAQSLLGARNASQVRGQDIMSYLCRISGECELNIGLYGGSSSEVLDLVVSCLRKDYPDIRIVFAYSPPFRLLTPDEDFSLMSDIRRSSVDILFVGLGCPKQEIWMYNHKNVIECTMLGVGAAFDFISGQKKHAPRWMQKIGLEWLFRLSSEPARLWKRYLINNPAFVALLFSQLIFRKRSSF